MSSPIDVFALRKKGLINEAYSLAVELIEEAPNDEWTIKAYAWCIYDLVKGAVNKSDYITAKQYIVQLDKITIDESDDVFFKAIEHVKNLAIPERKVIFQAKEQSKNGNHKEALILFKQAMQQFPNDIDLNTQFAWELWKEGKIIFETENVNVLHAKRLLADYIKLQNERPSQLHTLFLRFADKIIDKDDFNLIAFLKLWDLSKLREEDFKPYFKDEKTYPSIAEKVIQHAAKVILDKKLSDDAEYFLHFLEVGIKKFPENIWLPYYKAKILLLLNRNNEAIEFLIPVVKQKIGEYWTWNLLAELLAQTDMNIALSSYCKCLLCKADEKFLANIRTKFAEILILKGFLIEAKVEIQKVLKTKEEGGIKISERLNTLKQTDWFINAPEKKNNNDFYNVQKQLSEEFIFYSLPWYNACLGSSFTITEKPDKPRRKIFINLPGEIIEVHISDRKFNTSRNFKEGDSIKVKGEYDKEKAFQAYLLEKRPASESFDLFEWHNGNVVHIIKNEKSKASAFRVSFPVNGILKEGIIDLNSLTKTMVLKEGQPVSVKYYQKMVTTNHFSFPAEKYARMTILSIQERPNGTLWDSFPEYVGVIDHINYEKGIAHLIINKQIDGVIKINQLIKVPKIGDRVLTKLKKVTKEDRTTYYTTLSCELTERDTSEKITHNFSGKIEISRGFGFASDVFIDSSLIEKYEIEDGEQVRGAAILNYNKKKGSWGWKAISISLWE